MSRHAGTARRLPHRSGMTLIELILAIAIASLVISLVLTVYRTVSVTMLGQEERRRGADAVADAVERIARDLVCTFAPKSDNSCLFVLDRGAPASKSPHLSFCAAVVPEGETDLRWFDLHRVTYRVDVEGGSAPVLLRESRPLSGPGALAPAVTNVLAREVESFRVFAYDGTEWKDDWPPGLAGCPRAARVELTARHGSGTKTFQTEVLIPAGNPVTSTVQRATL